MWARAQLDSHPHGALPTAAIFWSDKLTQKSLNRLLSYSRSYANLNVMSGLTPYLNV